MFRYLEAAKYVRLELWKFPVNKGLGRFNSSSHKPGESTMNPLHNNYSASDLNPVDPESATNGTLEHPEVPLGVSTTSNIKHKANWSSIVTAGLGAREDAFLSRLTGVQGGRVVDVSHGNTGAAMRQLNSILRANNVAQDQRDQRFYMKPGKRAERKRAQRHRRDFLKGFKILVDTVKDATRKGY